MLKFSQKIQQYLLVFWSWELIREYLVWQTACFTGLDSSESVHNFNVTKMLTPNPGKQEVSCTVIPTLTK